MLKELAKLHMIMEYLQVLALKNRIGNLQDAH